MRLADDAEVLEQRPFGAVIDATWLRGGAVLVYGNERGLFVLDDSEDAPRQLDSREQAVNGGPDQRSKPRSTGSAGVRGVFHERCTQEPSVSSPRRPTGV